MVSMCNEQYILRSIKFILLLVHQEHARGPPDFSYTYIVAIMKSPSANVKYTHISQVSIPIAFAILDKEPFHFIHQTVELC